MNRDILLVFLSILSLFGTSALCMEKEDVLNETPQAGVVEYNSPAFSQDGVVKPENVDDGDFLTPGKSAVFDNRILAIKIEAQQRIQSVRETIHQLADKNQEGDLQKEIEQIKLDAEIARLAVLRQDAEDQENFDLADELQKEIDHLETIDLPVYGTQDEQVRQYGVPVSGTEAGKEGK